MINIAFKYCGQEFYIHDQKYNNGRLALVIDMTSDTRGIVYGILTVNLPGEHLDKGEFFVKTWSENEDIANHLRNSGIFEDTGKRVRTGLVKAEVWKFKEDEEEEEEKQEYEEDPEPLRRK